MFKYAFYNGRAEGAKLVHKAILTVSDPWVHVESIFSDGLSWSSEFGIGPRFKDILYSHPERWLFVEMPCFTPEIERVMRYKAEMWVKLREAGFSDYDSRGAIGCTLTGQQNPWNPFCSEGCYEIIPSNMKLDCINHRMHPSRLLEVVKIIRELNQ